MSATHALRSRLPYTIAQVALLIAACGLLLTLPRFLVAILIAFCYMALLVRIHVLCQEPALPTRARETESRKQLNELLRELPSGQTRWAELLAEPQGPPRPRKKPAGRRLIWKRGWVAKYYAGPPCGQIARPARVADPFFGPDW